MSHPPPLGLLLLTGGQGRRLGGPKHPRLHSEGCSWGAHLVNVFTAIAPKGPIQVLGEPLPDRSDLYCHPDEGLGASMAIVGWATRPSPRARRWWVVACDQVRWTPALLREWHQAATGGKVGTPEWVIASAVGRPQPLGGFLSEELRGPLAELDLPRLNDLVRALPHRVVEWDSAVWEDVDTPADLARWRDDQGKPTTR